MSETIRPATWPGQEDTPVRATAWPGEEEKAPPERSTGEKVVRAVQQPAAGFNESVARTLGFLPDLVGSGVRGLEDLIRPAPTRTLSDLIVNDGKPEDRGHIFAPAPGKFTDWARKGVKGVATLGGMLPDAPKPETTTEKILYGAGEGAGDAASMVIPGAAIARGAQAGGKVSKLAEALSAQPVTQVAAGATGGAVREATDSPAAGLAAALATPMGASLLARGVMPIRPNLPAETKRLIGEAEKEGIPLSPAARTGSSALKYIESTFDILPFTGGKQEALRQAEREAFNRASLSKSGTAGDVATPDVINAARARIGQGMDDIAERSVLDITPTHEKALNDLADEITTDYSADVARPVIARINEILNHPDGRTLPGMFYKNFDSKIAAQMKDLQGVQKTALGKVRDVIRAAMDDSIGPQDAQDWQELRRQYANLMVTEKAASGAGEAAATGNVSPLGLRAAVDKSTGQGYGRGRGDQNDLARIGQSLLRPPPQSGTGPRQFWQGMLTGAPFAGGAFLGGADPLTAALTMGLPFALPKAAQAAYNSKAGQRYLTEGIPGLAPYAKNAPDINRGLAAALALPYARDAATEDDDVPTIVVRPQTTGPRR